MRLRRFIPALLVLTLTLTLSAQDAEKKSGAADDIRFEIAKLEAQNPMTRARAMDALWRYTAQEANWNELRKALPKLKELLGDPLPVVRARSALTLLRLAPEETRETAYDTLEKDAEHPKSHVRLAVVEAAELMGGDERLNALLRRLAEDEDLDVQEAAQAAINSLNRPRRGGGGPQVPQLELIDVDFNPFIDAEAETEQTEEEIGSPSELAQARDAVRRVPDPSALETLARLTRFRGGFQTEEGGLVSLAETIAPAVQPLIQLLREEEPARPLDLRYAAMALGCADEEALPFLAASLEYPHPHTREAAAFALMRRGADQRGRPIEERSFAEEAGALAFALTDESPAARAYAAVGIGKMRGEAYADEIAAALADEDGRTRTAAALAAAMLGRSEEAAAAILGGMESPDLLTRAAAVSAFPTAAPNGLESFLRLMEGAPPRLLYYAVGAAAAFENGQNILQMLAQAPDEEMRLAALTALSPADGAALFPLVERIPDEEAKPALRLEIAAGAGWTYFSNAQIEIPLADALVTYTGPANGSARTDARGRLTLENLPQGVYLARVEAEGHLPIEAPIALYKGAARIRLHRHY